MSCRKVNAKMMAQLLRVPTATRIAGTGPCRLHVRFGCALRIRNLGAKKIKRFVDLFCEQSEAVAKAFT